MAAGASALAAFFIVFFLDCSNVMRMTMIPGNLLSAGQQMQNMASGAGDKRTGQLLTILSVALMGIFVIKELKGAFKDEYREWEKHHATHEGKKSHAESVRQSQGHDRVR